MQDAPLVALEALHRAIAGRAVPAHVGGPFKPPLGLLVEIRVVGELPLWIVRRMTPKRLDSSVFVSPWSR